MLSTDCCERDTHHRVGGRIFCLLKTSTITCEQPRQAGSVLTYQHLDFSSWMRHVQPWLIVMVLKILMGSCWMYYKGLFTLILCVLFVSIIDSKFFLVSLAEEVKPACPSGRTCFSKSDPGVSAQSILISVLEQFLHPPTTRYQTLCSIFLIFITKEIHVQIPCPVFVSFQVWNQTTGK